MKIKKIISNKMLYYTVILRNIFFNYDKWIKLITNWCFLNKELCIREKYLLDYIFFKIYISLKI